MVEDAENEERAARDLDRATPNIARMNDYFLGGKDNFAVDRETADALLALAPEIKPMAEEMQDFRRRLVRHLLAAGVRRFLDLGSGLPTRDATHQIAHAVDPSARVVYVNDDLVVLAHARALLGGAAGTAVVDGSVVRPADLLSEPAVGCLLEGGEPVAVLALGTLQFIPKPDGPVEGVHALMEVLPSGSHLGLSHVVFDQRPDLAGPIVEIYQSVLSTEQPSALTTDDVMRYFDGLDVMPPGLVHLPHWRPEDAEAARAAEPGFMVGGAARKP
ncbi:SAM-dependent methyltransferase [Actinocorallia sp. A-T 12471]|uniref:SAM-dependent methyltransferase n=1 Tax=Actinocorallia sp. A-T 12471 TaxID=3089813 RepID=UPI0029CD7772|nr:SAM-dependent methyltransferase [Actinocorallia sp. A-T 12471]MDX6738334.1 SAM-dependent methyltransferase [Actinocorallia sp. A-T 12471]